MKNQRKAEVTFMSRVAYHKFQFETNVQVTLVVNNNGCVSIDRKKNIRSGALTQYYQFLSTAVGGRLILAPLQLTSILLSEL